MQPLPDTAIVNRPKKDPTATASSMEAVEKGAGRFETICKAQDIPFAIFFRERDARLGGAATLSTRGVAKLIEPYLKQANTVQLSRLLQSVTTQIQERCLEKE